MSCPTAARWFVDDMEYYANEADYALVGSSAKLIRREIDEGNNRPIATNPDGSLVPPSFGIYFYNYNREDTEPYLCYDFAVSGRMLWADVDTSKPEHKEQMKKAIYGLDLSKAELDERYKDVWKKLIPHLGGKGKRNVESDNEEETTEARKERIQADKARRTKRNFCAGVENGELDGKFQFFLFDLCKEPDRRQLLIELLTGQTQSSTKRPLMLLVGMIDDMRNPKPGEKSGYVVGYDVANDRFICKPFFSDKDHHPLTSSWYEDLHAKYPDDRVIFDLSPKDLVEDFLKKSAALTHALDSGTLKEVQPTESESESGLAPYLDTSGDESYPYVLLARTIAVEFVEPHWYDLVQTDAGLEDIEDDDELLREIRGFRKAKEDVLNNLNRMRIPLVAKTEKEEKVPCLCK